ncbi:MAG: DUF6483 family protein [Roseburia sp.]|nr:DUF6483 family protein [Roseburia sp.]
MFEQDYIMRLIKEMVRAVLKLLFHIDTEQPTDEILQQEETRARLSRLLNLADMGNINEAENEIYEMTSNGNQENLKAALLFYSHLNDKEDSFLQEHGFSRNEIKQGMESLLSRYGLSGIIELF